MFARFFAALTLAALAGTACSEAAPTGPAETQPTLTVNAVTDWGYIVFDGDEATLTTVADRETSDAWDIAFFGTSVMLNGGAAGPAGVTGHCVCQNASATDAALMNMTAATELSDFEAVTAAQIPTAATEWESDALAAAIDGWYNYNFETHVTTPAPENVWKVRTASGTSYAKFHVTGIAGATQAHAGVVTFEYALQSAAGAAFEATRTESVDVSAGAVHFDLETGEAVDGSAAWDVRFDGWDIRVNGGVSGTGSAGATLAGSSFESVTDASDLTASHYAADAFGGVFEGQPWYRYNLAGNHQIWPTFDVYLIRKGDSVYRIQLTNYYDAVGEARHVTFRYARLQ